ncbi:hypothetical protein Psal071_00111 [Piscirickettsia salmonis]|uniref:Uncharacterized protein n=2 Tax=Piscirickettsia salmonis TaxID=1238 RepID=A0A9Q6LJ76_PISSA|nr:YjbH domain-containing protein [Piscirickettsia salmonis]RNC79151.1 hypothetical protein DA717_00740 [Piscirickettsiaceae bacterium NZ-RLO2]ALA26417.1 S-layer protein [Piscirickettsia salmonis]QGN75946.1 hypothetical protein Psal001_00112 [Piscirickettsia salmonis]QGN79510.1 hypothetical protein Psal002_00111 [Piscirickettsia salmonis]QGN83100.1 hypothetical protein Psal003_00111 [Piscirickettsia salmonis]
MPKVYLVAVYQVVCAAFLFCMLFSVYAAKTAQEISKSVSRHSISLNAYDHIAVLPNVLSPLAPTAVGAQWGDVYFGFAAANHSSGEDNVNGVLVVGFGIGDPEHVIGLDVSMAVTSINPADGGFAKDRHVDLKLHRRLPYQSAIAVGVENLLASGLDRDFSKTYYLVLTKDFQVTERQLSISLGIGNGRFRSQEDINIDKSSIGVFADVSIGITDWLDIFADWTGHAVSAGVSLQPVKKLPLTLTVAALDIGKSAVSTVPIAVGLGFTHRF